MRWRRVEKGGKKRKEEEEQKEKEKEEETEEEPKREIKDPGFRVLDQGFQIGVLEQIRAYAAKQSPAAEASRGVGGRAGRVGVPVEKHSAWVWRGHGKGVSSLSE